MEAINSDPVNDRRLPRSPEEARSILRSIRLERGFLGNEYAEELSRMSIGLRQATSKLEESLRRKTVKYTNSIAGELYSHKTRFIYELLQNADDSSYETGQSEPRITISLYPDKVLIDTNEKGFTIANVKAVCDTGESSKKASAEDESIGEKGYGFKSVFGVAYRARIQSGYWSFYFEHRDGDDGLGMITPIDIDPVTLPAAVHTRIELLLHEDTDGLLQKIHQELSNLHDTATFFLQKIETLVIHIHSKDKPKKSTEIKRKIATDHHAILNRVVSLTRTDTTDGFRDTVVTRYFHVREEVVTNMPADKHRKGISRSTLKLAFPFNPTTKSPIIDANGQYFFAYLPLYRNSNLSFLIHADFITATNRQSVLDCAWNEHLRAAVAVGFCNAVRLFYNDDILRYQWLRYLPLLLAVVFEGPLFSLIKAELLDAAVFQTWQSRSRACASSLRIVPDSYRHSSMSLFRDLQEEMYLAPEYSRTDYSLLRKIGIRDMTQRELLDRLVYDLASSVSAFRNTPVLSQWHDKCSSVLVNMLLTPADVSIVRTIRRLQIVPLRHQSGDSNAPTGVAEWVSATECESRLVYFSETLLFKSQNTTANPENLVIPRGLPIRVIHEESSISSIRKALFARLGVTSCHSNTVIDAIFERHRRWVNSVPPVSVGTLVSHLRYLFWFYGLHGRITQPLIVARESRATSILTGPVTTLCYLKSDSPYSAWFLLKGASNSKQGDLSNFVSDEYISAESAGDCSYGLSWMQWLEEVVGLRRRPLLVDLGPSATQLSPVMRHVLQHRPEDFIPTLEAHWVTEYRDLVANTRAVGDVLSNTEVQCERTKPTKLSRTYIPTALLRSEAERIGLLESTPFLKLPERELGEKHDKWQFLSEFGVGSQANLGFYLELLGYVQIIDKSESLSVLEIVSKIYTTVGSLCNWDQAALVKKKLTENRGIYVPSNKRDQRWRQPGDCLWDAPPCISIKSALVNHYDNDKNISALFRTYLQVQDVHVNDYLDQLRYLKRTGLDANSDFISHRVCAEVYKELHKYEAAKELLARMRQVIESEKLIFAFSAWHSPSGCLWSSDTSISDQISIAGIYTELQGFFVTKLHIKQLTVSMLISDLTRKATAKTPLSITSAKSLIFKINTMLPSDVLDYRLRGKFNELEIVKYLPVRSHDGQVALTDATADFAIVDNQRIGGAFSQHADMLDFDLDEVHILRPFFEATDLAEHYLSNLVTEVSSIEGDPPESLELTRRLQGVAYALFCCAVHFKSSKIIHQNSSLYNSLLSTSVHQAEKMGTSLLLEQHGKSIKVPSTKTQLKIDTDTTPWKIYVPEDMKARRSCYSSQFPQAILELLGISGNNATLAVNNLLNERHDRESESLVLEQFDVLPISWVNRQPALERRGSITPAVETSPAHSPSRSIENSQSRDHTRAPSTFDDTPVTPGTPVSSRASKQTSSSPFSTVGLPTSSNTSGPSSIFGSSPRSFMFGEATSTARSASATPVPTFGFAPAAASRASLSPFGHPSLFGRPDAVHRRSVSASLPAPFTPGSTTSVRTDTSPRTDPAVQKAKYRALLENIINRVLGDNHAWDLNGLAEALPETVGIPMLFDKDETFGVRSEDHMAHDMKIGAAGEVYVVEKLLAAGLPGFTQNNWLSTIRHEAKVHERYKDMPDSSPDLPTGGRAEPADIVYADADGSFTKFLETQDCVGVEDWLAKPPNPKRKYFIEVKATTRNCDTTFYMSKGQHTRMLDMRKHFFTPANDVYIICRVYNLLSNAINMRFYVSPGRNTDARGSLAESWGSLEPTPAEGEGNPFSVQKEPILKFTSRGFEVKPIK